MLTNQQPRDFSMRPKATAEERGRTMSALTGGNPRPSQSSSGTEQGQGIEDEDMHETPENMADTLDFGGEEVNGPSRIRTCNQGIMRQGTGSHKDHAPLRLMASPGSGPHCGCIEDAALAQIVAAWPSLPEHTKLTIATLIEASTSRKKAG
jgi:hypothetical protein